MNQYDYGLWDAVIFNVLFFGLFVVSFLKPSRKVEWQSMGVFSAFLVALFAEMYGFPLTIYILTSVFGLKMGVAQPFGHINGHLIGTFLGLSDAGKLLVCQVGNVLMIAGLIIMGIGWRSIHGAQGQLVTSGTYRWVRHPQYSGLFLLIVGLLVQWPTLIGLAMAPVLMISYVLLARREEKHMIELFGDVYLDYMARTPAFFPSRRRYGSGDVRSPGSR